jgi:hypothetical protein
MNTSCSPARATSAWAPRSRCTKYGSENARSSRSETTNPTESLRRVTSERAARFGV